MTRHYTCRWCWWGCHSWWHDLLNMLPWGQRQGVPLTLDERTAYDAGFRAAIAKIDADLRAEGLGLHDQLGLAALDAEMRAQRIAMRDQVEADVLGGIRIHLPEGLTADQQSAWYTAFAQPKTQCADCGGEPDHLYCWRWAERLHCWLLRFRWYS